MNKKKKRKRYRLKSSFKRFLIYFLVFFSIGIYTIKESIKIVEEFKYRETNEYKMIQIGYSLEEAQTLIKVLPEEYIVEILNQKYNEDYNNIVSQKYFLLKNYKSYLEYKEYHEKTSYEDVIAIVNVHASAGWYNKTLEANPDNDTLILVNKFYKLDENYKRDDIKNTNLAYSYSNNKVSSIVIENFEKMYDDIEKELDVHLMINSSYRSYKDQQNLYNEYSKVSFKYADTYVSRPGYSEHQTGLSIDITSLEHRIVNEFIESPEYEWLLNNCYKYGFILRYPKDKKYLTGYDNEEWHFRYVGKDVAKKIYDENITFDEYYAYYIEK